MACVWTAPWVNIFMSASNLSMRSGIDGGPAGGLGCVLATNAMDVAVTGVKVVPDLREAMNLP